MNKILVLGGTGFVGRHVCEELVERNGGGGGRILVPSRRPARAQHIRMLPTVELVQANVHDAAQLRRLVAGCDAVINLVAILHGRKADFDKVHVALPRQLAQACVDAGVKRLLHVSALGVGEGAPSNYLRSKTAGEAVLKAQRGLELTILRPSVIFGAEDRFLNLFASLQKVFPLMPLAGASASFQPVWVGDVAHALVRCLDDRSTIGQTYECAGPQVYTLADLVRLAGRLSGHPRLVLPLPEALGRLQALAMECLPGEPLMSRDNIASMRVPNVASGRLPGLQALGITPVDLPSVAAAYLGGQEPRQRYDRFRAFARRG